MFFLFLTVPLKTCNPTLTRLNFYNGSINILISVNLLFRGMLTVFLLSRGTGRGGGSDGVLRCNMYDISCSGSDVCLVCITPPAPMTPIGGAPWLRDSIAGGFLMPRGGRGGSGVFGPLWLENGELPGNGWLVLFTRPGTEGKQIALNLHINMFMYITSTVK